MSYVVKYSVKQAGDPALPQRKVQTGSYQGRAFEVVTAYDAALDRFPVHVYLVGADGTRQKLSLGTVHAGNERDAFRAGWNELDNWCAVN